jgi:hypothetical protein
MEIRIHEMIFAFFTTIRESVLHQLSPEFINFIAVPYFREWLGIILTQLHFSVKTTWGYITIQAKVQAIERSIANSIVAFVRSVAAI